MVPPLKYESAIVLENVPIQWGQKFELYYPDLPGFPTVYVHIIEDGKRTYGFPITANFKQGKGDDGSVEILFLSNKDLDSDESLKGAVKTELENRFGLSDKIGMDDIIRACKGNASYENFFRELWKPISEMHGKYLPYGRFFEEIYSIIRFVSAWAPKTGRQSEMRMLYNFISIFGECVTVPDKWKHLDFFLLPTYADVRSEDFSEFPKFSELYKSMKVVWENFFTVRTPFYDSEIRSMERKFPDRKNEFIEKITGGLVSKGMMSSNQKSAVDRLVDMFNRNPMRTSFFIWSIMSIRDNDFKKWDKEQFKKFYLETSAGVGISPKVVACWLQQGFGKEEFIPIDIWVEAFHTHALGIESKSDFFDSFSSMGKLERPIWIASQANKTNIRTFFDTLWCTRYGNNGNKDLRGANPISCYECKLRRSCPSYQKIANKYVYILPETDSSSDLPNEVQKFAEKKSCMFVCLTRDGVPKKIFKLKGRSKKKWSLVDEFSGYLLDVQKTSFQKEVTTVSKFVEELPDASGFNFMEIS